MIHRRPHPMSSKFNPLKRNDGKTLQLSQDLQHYSIGYDMHLYNIKYNNNNGWRKLLILEQALTTSTAEDHTQFVKPFQRERRTGIMRRATAATIPPKMARMMCEWIEIFGWNVLLPIWQQTTVSRVLKGHIWKLSKPASLWRRGKEAIRRNTALGDLTKKTRVRYRSQWRK